jgi:hypothetical protein
MGGNLSTISLFIPLVSIGMAEDSLVQKNYVVIFNAMRSCVSTLLKSSIVGTGKAASSDYPS